jgi:hypothetical protein
MTTPADQLSRWSTPPTHHAPREIVCGAAALNRQRLRRASCRRSWSDGAHPRDVLERGRARQAQSDCGFASTDRQALERTTSISGPTRSASDDTWPASSSRADRSPSCRQGRRGCDTGESLTPVAREWAAHDPIPAALGAGSGRLCPRDSRPSPTRGCAGKGHLHAD